MRKITVEEHFVTPTRLKHTAELKWKGRFFTNHPDSMSAGDNPYPDPVDLELSKNNF